MKKTLILIAALALTGCSATGQKTWLGNPVLTAEQVETGKQECLSRNTDPQVYPNDQTPVRVFCKIRSVLPKGYVRPPPTVVIIVNP